VLRRRLTDVYMPMYSRVIPMLSQVHATEIIGRMLDVVDDDRRLEAGSPTTRSNGQER
jgi:hypothetical protein